MDRSNDTHRFWLVCLLLSAATLAAFWPVFHNGFVLYDDPDYVLDNPGVLHGLSGAGVVWAFQPHAGNWHPLTWLSHMLDVSLFGLNAFGHHLVSLLFHAANTLLLFTFLRRTTGALWRSAVVAGLFALHPLHVESVAWVAERKDVLSGFWALLALCAYAGYATRAEQPSGPAQAPQPQPAPGTRSLSRWCFYFAALLCFCLGLMSKPMLVTLPFLLLLLDFWPLRRFVLPPGRWSLKPLLPLLVEKLPFASLTFASCVVTYLAQQAAGAVSTLEALTVDFRVSNALISYVRYLAKAFCPVGLAVFYPLPKEWPIELVLGATLVLVVVTALVFWRARQAPFLVVGWLWYLGSLVPVIGLIQVGQQALADRYMYLPIIGLCLMAVWSGAELAARWRKAGSGLALLGTATLLACALLTFKQTEYWRDDQTLFGHTLDVTHDNAVAQNNLGVSLYNSNNLATAEIHFAEAIRLKPKYSEALVNLSLCRSKQGRADEALDFALRAVQARPNALAEYNLANLLRDQGKLDDAATHFRSALALKPDMPEAWYNLGNVLSRQRQHEEAIAAYTKALDLRPAYIDAYLNLGSALVNAGRREEGLARFKTAVQLAPDNPDTHFDLAAALNTMGDHAGAAAEYAEVCRLRPNDMEARANLGQAYLDQGKLTEAIATFEAALREHPTAPAHHYLALMLDAQGQGAQAAPHYREAVRLAPNDPTFLNDLAWLLATSPIESVRNGTEAVTLGERACELTGGKEARFFGTLDAAYAEAGRFDDAIKTATKARELALASGQKEIAARAEQRLQFYRNHKPWRNPPEPAAGDQAK